MLYIIIAIVPFLASVAAIVTIPSIAVMELIQSLGLTDPGWFVVLHALLGGVIGFWAHRITRPLQNARQWPLIEVAADIWANRTRRYIAIAILVFLVLISC